ncbi:unnamed protein product [Calypogeia fissa]
MQKRSNPPQQHHGAKRLRQQQLQRAGSSPHNIGADKRQQRFWPCPLCNRSFALFRLEEHVNQCLDTSPIPPTSPSAPFITKRDTSCKPLDVELYPTSIQGKNVDGRGEPHNLERSPSSGKTSCVRTQKILSLESNLMQQPPHVNVSCSLSLVKTSSLPTERGLSLEGNLMPQPPHENVSCSVSSVKTSCLPTERGLSLEGNLIQETHNGNVEDRGGGGGVFAVEDVDGLKAQLRCKLEYSSSNPYRDCESTDLSAENHWTGEDGGASDEKGMAEDGRDGNGLAKDRPPAGFKLFQRQVQSQARLSMFRNFSSAALQRKASVTVLQPGMVLFRSWLDLDTQQKFVRESQSVSHLFRRPTTSGGGKYHIYSMCWGPQWDAKAHRYAAKGPENPIPSWMFELAQKLAQDAQQHTSVYPVDSTYAPDVGLVNFYPVKANELGVIGLGGHQDLDDSGLMPVVSVSIGDSMTFFYRRFPPYSRRKSGVSISVDEEAVRSCEDGDAAHNREHQILLESGDVLVFGGKSRLVYHGTRHVQPGTRPPGLHMVPGRLNFTFRQTIAKAI